MAKNYFKYKKQDYIVLAIFILIAVSGIYFVSREVKKLDKKEKDTLAALEK